ncbi:MAG: GNAT family N-acetyltransferase [Acidobacteria bacterium]|nr:GNAT family N-acetyltransferase [Acidobacteriota bacterium]MBI3424504.1 GNAT family N-acetyltransferase [Acidobacteriota bacterium]
MKAEFKRAALADVEVLFGMMQDFYAHEGLALDETNARRALLGLLQNESYGLVLLIVVGADVAGYTVLTLGYSLEFGGMDAFVDELYLRAPHRGHGLGKEALEFLAQMCIGLGIRALHLEVERANTRAQAVYRQFGFVDHDRYLLTKWLA